MTTATAKPISHDQLRAIHVLWREISPGLGESELGEREARLDYLTQVVKRPIATSKDLSLDEAQKVIERMKQDLGQEFRAPVAGFRRRGKSKTENLKSVNGAMAAKIGKLACELWGSEWNAALAARLSDPQYGAKQIADLSPRQARNLVEELLQRIAVIRIRNLKIENGNSEDPVRISRREIETEKAALRARFFKHEGTETQSHDEDSHA